MSKRATTNKRRAPSRIDEADSVYVLKLVLFFLLGSLWLRVERGDMLFGLPFPVGFLIGLLFARHEHFMIDRKLEYAVMVVAMFVSFFLPLGIVLAL